MTLSKERSDILRLEGAMKLLDGYEEGDGPCRITHYFAPGVYAREMWMPADCLITGKIHKTSHLNMLSQGKVTVSSKGESVTYEAPYTFVSPVGTKRAIYAHEDSTWTTIHPTDLEDPEEIEEEIIAETFPKLDGFLARRDYDGFLLESGFTEEDVQKVTHGSEVMVIESDVFCVTTSEIEGVGLFPVTQIRAGDIIAPALLDGVKTTAGRYTNHSGAPNAEMIVMDDKNINLVALRDIVDEEITTNYRENLRVQGLKRVS
jgi:hypothetical protein